MPWSTEITLQQFLTFSLVLARVSGLVMTAPILGASEVPMRVRALLALAFALVIAPTQVATSDVLAAGTIGYLLTIVSELLVGVALGIGVMLLLAGMQIAGQIISQMSGMSLAEVFNPSLDAEVPLFSQLLYFFALAIFVSIGGQRLMLAAMLDTFVTIPAGTASIENHLPETLAALLGQSFSLGVRAAAPAATALLLATLVLGLVSRTLPQLNVLTFGFGVNALVTFGTLSLSLGAIAWAFEEQLQPFVAQLLAGLQSGTG